MLFSERNRSDASVGAPQINDLDQRTRNQLWNELHAIGSKFSHLAYTEGRYRPNKLQSSVIVQVLNDKITDYDYAYEAVNAIEKCFDSGSYVQIFDILELTIASFSEQVTSPLIKQLNRVFERHNVGYRVIGKQIAQVLDEASQEVIERALVALTIPEHVRNHLRNALTGLGVAEHCNPVESLTESIKAVEAAARVVVGNENATLGDALKEIRNEFGTHKAWIMAMEKLYAFASDEGGVRHGSKGQTPDVSVEDARLSLVICSSMCEWLLVKASKTL